MKASFAKDQVGTVHLVDSMQGEHTVCGWAFDCGSDEPDRAWSVCSPEPITCPECLNAIAVAKSIPKKFLTRSEAQP